MCFSAPVSFAAAAVAGAAGVAALRGVRRSRDVPLAATPLVFAAHQAVEGLVWLSLPVAGAPSALTFAFLLIAVVYWPLHAPVAAALAEPDPRRRRWILGLVGVGVCVAGLMAWRLFNHPHTAVVDGGHIKYATGVPVRNLVIVFYLAATAVPFLISTRRGVAAFGAVVLAGYAVSYVGFHGAFISVWCFFASVASLVLAWTFLRPGERPREAAA